MEFKNVLVTGGAGFIGSHLVVALSNLGYKVVVLDNLRSGNKLMGFHHPNVQLIEGDVRDKKVVLNASRSCQVIIHLAAIVGVNEVIQHAADMIETETIGMHNIIDAAIKSNVKKIIYASSSAVYHGLQSDFNKESDEPHLVNTYAIAKCLNEKYLEVLTESENISTNAIRLFNIYGSRQDDRMVIPRFFNHAIKQQPIEVFGCGTQTRDFTHINDVVSAIIKLSYREDLNGVFNIARGIETNILSLAKAIKKTTNSSSPIQLMEFPEKRKDYYVKRRVGCSKKLFTHTGFQPAITLTEGLSKLYKNLLKARVANTK